MDEANALILQHLKSLQISEELAQQLQKELEWAKQQPPRSAEQEEASSLVQLVLKSEPQATLHSSRLIKRPYGTSGAENDSCTVSKLNRFDLLRGLEVPECPERPLVLPQLPAAAQGCRSPGSRSRSSTPCTPRSAPATFGSPRKELCRLAPQVRLPNARPAQRGQLAQAAATLSSQHRLVKPLAPLQLSVATQVERGSSSSSDEATPKRAVGVYHMVKTESFSAESTDDEEIDTVGQKQGSLAGTAAPSGTEDISAHGDDDCSGDGGVLGPPCNASYTISMPLTDVSLDSQGFGSPLPVLPDFSGRGSPPLQPARSNPVELLRSAGTFPPGTSCYPTRAPSAPAFQDDGSGMISGLSSMHGFFGAPVTPTFSEPAPRYSQASEHFVVPPHAGRPSFSPSNLRPAVSVPVVLHVYDLGASGGCRTLNSVLSLVGAGVFHCGVEVYDREWSFRKCVEGTGVFSCRPRLCQGQSFAESILMGQTVLPKCDVLRVLQQLSKKWLGSDYHTLKRNCCHFCKELCRLLNVGPVPERLMAAAAAGEYLEMTGMSYRSILLRKFRERLCCNAQCPEMDVEDVPDAVPTLALPSNTASPSQAIPARLHESMVRDHTRTTHIMNL